LFTLDVFEVLFSNQEKVVQVMGGTSQLLSSCCSFRNTVHFSVPIAMARIILKLYKCFQLVQYMQAGLNNCLTFSSLEDCNYKLKANTSFMFHVLDIFNTESLWYLMDRWIMYNRLYVGKN
jgi:hypothetical protein